MLFRLKLHSLHQFTVLAVCIAVSAGACYFLDFQPRLRAGLVLAAASLLIGAAIASAAVAIFTLQRRFSKRRTEPAIEAPAAMVRKSPYAIIAAAALVSAAGEELLLRGFIFNYLLSVSAAGAFIGNALLVYVLYFSRTTGHTLAIIKVIEATALALLFWNTRSVAAIAAARLVSELLVCFAMRSQRILGWVTGYSIHGSAYEAR